MKTKILNMNSKFGFTLMELLVVVGIIAILATLVIALTGNARDKTKDSKIRSQLGQMNSQAFLFSGVGSGTIVSPYLMNGTIIGQVAGGTDASRLFNNTTVSSNSLYLLASKLPRTHIYYGWNGQNTTTTGRWFFAAQTSVGAFCVDWKNEKKEYVGTAISSNPTLTGSWTGPGVFPNAISSGPNPYSCN
jgi:prepilin-type N-terminal cleavage/methylation domain-containing protein